MEGNRVGLPFKEDIDGLVRVAAYEEEVAVVNGREEVAAVCLQGTQIELCE